MNPPLWMALTIAVLAAIALGAVVIRRLDTIHVLVDGNLSEVKAELAWSRSEIVLLREQLGGAKQEVEEVRGNAGPEPEA